MGRLRGVRRALLGLGCAVGLTGLSACGFITVGSQPTRSASEISQPDRSAGSGPGSQSYLPASRAKLAEGLALLANDPMAAAHIFEALAPLCRTEAAKVMLAHYVEVTKVNPHTSLEGLALASQSTAGLATREGWRLRGAALLLRAWALRLAGHPEEIAASFGSYARISDCNQLPCEGLGAPSWSAIAEQLVRDSAGTLKLSGDDLQGRFLAPVVRLSATSSVLEQNVSRSADAVHDQLKSLKEKLGQGPFLAEVEVTSVQAAPKGRRIESAFAGGNAWQESCRDAGKIEVRGSGGITEARFKVSRCHDQKHKLSAMKISLQAEGNEPISSGSSAMFMVRDVRNLTEDASHVSLGAAKAVWDPPLYEPSFSLKAELSKLGIYPTGLRAFEPRY